MAINWRLVTIFPLFAVVASILSGAIGGVAFVDIIVRSVVWAIVFAAIGIGVSYIIDKFLPGLKDVMEGSLEGMPSRSAEEGGFEAFIPEENPHELEEIRHERDDGLDTEESAFFGSMDHTERGAGEKLAELSDGEDEVPDFASINSEFTDLSPTGDADADADSDTMTSDDEAGTPTLRQAAEPREDSENAAENEELSFSLDDGGLDKLSEFGPIDDSFSFGSSSSQHDEGGSFSKPYKNTKVSDFEQDPLKTSKAIHTMIQRDKEG